MHPVEDTPDERTWARRALAAANPRFVLSQADGYPPGIKQFLQVGLLITYPAWLICLLLFWPLWVVGKVLEGILWVIFWPVRAAHRRNNPEQYAAFRAEQLARKEAARAGRSTSR